MLISLTLITIISVIIVDISGFITSIKKFIAKRIHARDYTNVHLKPFDCSFCMNFWISLVYLFYNSQLCLPYICYILCMSMMTVPIKEILNTIIDFQIYIINKVHDKL